MVNKPIYSCILLTYLSREALLFTVLVNIPQHTCHLRHITVEILFVSGYLYYQIGKIFGLVFYLLSLICSLVFNFSQPFSFTHICASLRAFRGTHWQDLLLRFVLVLGDLYACLPLSTLPLFFPIYFFFCISLYSLAYLLVWILLFANLLLPQLYGFLFLVGVTGIDCFVCPALFPTSPHGCSRSCHILT